MEGQIRNVNEEAHPVNEYKSGYKKRQYTTCMFVYVMSIGVIPIVMALWALLESESSRFVWTQGLQLVAGAWMAALAFVKFHSYSVVQ